VTSDNPKTPQASHSDPSSLDNVALRQLLSSDWSTRPTAAFVIVVAAGWDMLRFIHVTPGNKVTIGSGVNDDLTLTNSVANPKHATIICMGDGSLSIVATDEPVDVNNKSVTTSPLKTGDYIGVGSALLHVKQCGSDVVKHYDRIVQRLDQPEKHGPTGLLTPAIFTASLETLLGSLDASASDICRINISSLGITTVRDQDDITAELLFTNLARVVLLGIRGDDLCGRCGDRIDVILNGANLQQAQHVGDRLLESLQAHPWRHIHAQFEIGIDLEIAHWSAKEQMWLHHDT